MKRVCIIQRVAVDYRKAFFLLLERMLAAEGIALTVAAGGPRAEEGLVDILDELSFGVRCRNRKIAGRSYWTDGAWRASRGADLIVMEQSNAALHLYGIILRRYMRRAFRRDSTAVNGGRVAPVPMTAFWGHGAHLNTAKAQPLRDNWKRFLATKVDWWFAYTQLSADIVARLGFPAGKVTIVNNAVDTAGLRAVREAMADAELLSLQRRLFGGNVSAPGRGGSADPAVTGVFCARLLPLKWIPFLLQALTRIHDQVPGFRMLIIGDGPERSCVKTFCGQNAWCAWVGARYGPECVQYLALGDVFLNPGALGLAVLDAFALGLPVFTTDNRLHGPEICYLRDGLNGRICAPDPESYARDVVVTMRQPGRLPAMKEQALADGKRYTLEDMARRFAEGVSACLSGA